MSEQSRPGGRRDRADNRSVDPDTPGTSAPTRSEDVVDTGGEPSEQAYARLDEATSDLRSRRDPRWVEISDRVLSGALRATRRSSPIRAMTATGPVHISEQVLVTYIRDALQDDVPDAALLHIKIDIAGKDTLGGVVLALIARYGVELLPVADRIRDLTAARLTEILGPVNVPVTVDVLHVHFSDVVDGDPHESNPWRT